MDARAHLWLLNQLAHSSSGFSFGAGGSSRSLRAARLRSTAGRAHGAIDSASHQVTARKKRKKSFLRRFHPGKLLHLASHFIPGAGLLT